MKNKQKILAVPTNIITGFLGVGKTSAIMHLLKQKPEHERWAILVNEFGEIGIDGSLFSASTAEQNNVFIKELPGGCMCCTAGAPMQITLNKLLHSAKPHRLIIEPTGLGHPFEVLQLLSNEFYRDVLDIQNTVTLVDARNLSDSRYTQHQTFTQQIQIADVIIGNKADLYNEQDKETLSDYLTHQEKGSTQLFFAEHGEISLDWLMSKADTNNETINTDGSHTSNNNHSHSHTHEKQENNQAPLSTQPFPASGFIKAENQGKNKDDSFNSIGWRFSGEKTFNKAKLLFFLSSLNVIRIKGVFITNEGTFSYNQIDKEAAKITVVTANESRIEIINETIDENWQEVLMQIIVTKN